MKTTLKLWACILLIGCNATKKPTNETALKVESKLEALTENTTHLQDEDLAPFYHGVASGDPYPTSLVLWTRITPKEKMAQVKVKWEIARDRSFKLIIDTGELTTGPEKDYTVKVVAEGLQPGYTHYYRFQGLGKYSATGTTKTTPTDDAEIKFAVVSCSNIEFGYFNAYAAIAKDDLNAVLHLGDYIYEYGPDVYGDKEFDRKNIPPHEILTLQDYRDRYAQYRLDSDLQAAHARHPFINIWDDHEITNNAYVDGAQNHQKDEGDYMERKAIAKQVYYEWLPIREDMEHYRKFDYGKNVELFMLDERLAGRTVQPDSITDPKRDAPDHALLGDTQMNWLIENLQNSEAQWKLIGNQVIFSFCDWGYETFRTNLDAWDGYPREQAQLADVLQSIDNVVLVTGDTHTAWAFEATNNPFEKYDKTTSEGAVAVEFGVTSISSGNSNERVADSLVLAHEAKIIGADVNPHLKYVNMRDHGYLKISLNGEQAIAEYKIVPTLKTRTSETKVDKAFVVKSGTKKLMTQD